jgi:O-antigen ligase
MPPSVAAIVCVAGIVLLFRLDRTEKAVVSPALWIPTIWVLIAGSRMVSVWLVGGEKQSLDFYLDGSPIDRFVLTVLLGGGLTVLVARWGRTAILLRANGPLILFFFYCALSALWSDYSDIAFKRWTKAFGDLVMVLVVITDPDRQAAVKRLLARAAFLLIPLSVLFIKYYPDLGRGYDQWTWSPYYSGVAIGKNGLGYVCLVVGLGSLWRWLSALRWEDRTSATEPLIAHGVILAMTLWLFWKADSATSFACFLVGGSLLVASTVAGLTRPGSPTQVLVGALVLLGVSGWFLHTGTDVVEAMGRDTTLTGRTELWRQLLQVKVDPFFGSGFESFWLGERVEKFWRMYWWHPNQAHNGYLEILLNLGWIGLALLAAVIVSAMRHILRTFRSDPETARLGFALLVAALLYNVTEAAFRGFHLVWIAFLLAVIAKPAAVDP